MDLLFNQATEDLVLSNGDLLATETTVDDLIQQLYFRLKTFAREWFWDATYGIDYLRDVFGVARKKSTIDAIFRAAIMKEALVEDIVAFTSSIQGNAYSCSFQVKSKTENTPLQFYMLVNETSLVLTTDGGVQLKTLL